MAAPTPEVEIDYDGEVRTRALYAAVELLGRTAEIDGTPHPTADNAIWMAAKFERYIKGNKD